MAVSLEVRPPFLDHRLVEFALLRLPILRDGDGKAAIAPLLDGKCPPEVLTRRKQGFGMPSGRWLEERPWLTRQVLQRLARLGLLRTDLPRHFRVSQLWTLHVLDSWIRIARPVL
jgi:asparagine synthase (glutamine-hydrolysing)